MEPVLGDEPGETGSGGQEGSQGTEQARQQGQRLAQQARQQAGELANRGTEQAKSQLANQKHDASQRMVPIQSALRETAQQLRRQGQGSVGQYAERAADQVERFSTYLRETDVDEIMDEVRGFARRRPALFVGSAAAVGFFATRFLKSSSSEGQGSSSAADGGFSTRTPTATSSATITHGTQEPPATALPPVGAEVERPVGRPSIARERTTEPPPVGS